MSIVIVYCLVWSMVLMILFDEQMFVALLFFGEGNIGAMLL